MENNQKETALKAIVTRVINGDTAAFELIVEEYKRLVYSTAFRIVKNREDAEEIAQDALVKAFRSLKNFGWNASFSSWLYRIVYNTALTHLRKKNIAAYSLESYEEKEETLPEESSREWELLHRLDREKYINLAINRLSAEDGLVLTLYYIAENSLPEIAQITGWGLSAVKVRVYRARKRLHTELQLLLNQETNELL
jgi:RNA polymerase sigma-70 factor (ECF subfamily)